MLEDYSSSKTPYSTLDVLQCPNYTSQRNVMLDKVKKITKTKHIAPQHVLNGYKKLSVNDNMNIIQAVCDFILSTKRLI